MPSPTDQSPLESAEGRGQLQARLAGFAKVMFLLNAALYPIGVFVRSSSGHWDGGGTLWQGPARWHGTVVLSSLAVWLFARRGTRSLGGLKVADAFLAISSAIAFGGMAWFTPPWGRPDLFVLFSVSMLMVIRAAMVPSSAIRSTAISAASLLPLVVGTYAYYRMHPLAPPAPAAGSLTADIAELSLAALVLAAVVSRTVHRLRERVREAMQLGQYTLDQKIGEGGMGVVWRARHAMLKRPTAIKLLAPDRSSERDVARFELEVQLTSVLTHPNTVQVYDYGRTPDGIFYYAMEYLEGLDLQKLVEGDGPQDPARVIQVLVQVCGALEEAHGVGLVHRDIKPANILLCQRAGSPDLVKVLDFGLARPIEQEQPGAIGLSLPGQIVGTPHYLAPESISGAQTVDGRSDLYALGGVAYLLLTGTPPFAGRTAVEICGHHLHTPVTPPSERLGRPVPADLEAVVLACLAKSPGARPQEAAALREALLRCQDAGGWTRERALAWWRSRGRSLRDRHAPRVALSETRPLAVVRRPMDERGGAAGP